MTPREEREIWRQQKREREANAPPVDYSRETPKQRKRRKSREKMMSRLAPSPSARPSGTAYMTYKSASYRPVQGGAPK